MPESFINTGEYGSAATERLRATIVELDATTQKQTHQLVVLTRWLVIFTVVLVALTAVLIWVTTHVA